MARDLTVDTDGLQAAAAGSASTGCGERISLFGSFSGTSGTLPTKNTRGGAVPFSS